MRKGIIFHGSEEEFQCAIKVAILSAISSISLLNEQKISSSKNEYISRKEAARILKISLPTLSKYVKQGFIRAHRIGSKVLFSQDDVHASLKEINSVKHCRRNPIL